jgi:hypothetical protein
VGVFFLATSLLVFIILEKHRFLGLVNSTLRLQTHFKNAPDVAAHRFGQDETYFTVREILAETSTVQG